jgi:hypothetical protein
VEVENDGFLVGDEWLLPTGLIWVAMSLLETTREISVAASLTPSSFSSACLINSYMEYYICKLRKDQQLKIKKKNQTYINICSHIDILILYWVFHDVPCRRVWIAHLPSHFHYKKESKNNKNKTI